MTRTWVSLVLPTFAGGAGIAPWMSAYTCLVGASLGEGRARKRFLELIARPKVPLAEAALAIAEEEYPGLPVQDYLRQIDDLAHAVDAKARGCQDASSVLRLMRKVLFEEWGFRGNADAYYDPRNSFLNEVLERRLGIPITLSILYMEVAARVGLPVYGVAFPGHFLVKYVEPSRDLFIDPFHGGEVLSVDDCVARLRAIAPHRGFDPNYFQAVNQRQILGRMLHNLKKIYVEAGDDIRALWVVDRLVLLSPNDATERRDRGLLEARLGGLTAALADLQNYLETTPGATDAPVIREVVAQIRSHSSYMN